MLNRCSREETTDSKITADQIRKLEDLGFKWRVRNEKRSVVERREALKAKAAFEAKAHEDAVTEAKAREETAAAVAAEVAVSVDVNTVQAAGVTAADVASGVMPPVPGIEMPVEVPVEVPVGVHVEVPVSVPVGLPEVAAEGATATSLDVNMEQTVADADQAVVDNATVAAMEASVQAAVDANATASMEVDGIQVPVPEPVHVPEVAGIMNDGEIPVPDVPNDLTGADIAV